MQAVVLNETAYVHALYVNRCNVFPKLGVTQIITCIANCGSGLEWNCEKWPIAAWKPRDEQG